MSPELHRVVQSSSKMLQIRLLLRKEDGREDVRAAVEHIEHVRTVVGDAGEEDGGNGILSEMCQPSERCFDGVNDVTHRQLIPFRARK